MITETRGVAIECWIRGHQADRGDARHDGEDFWSRCKRCGTTLIRDADGWRKPSDPESVAHAGNVDVKADLDVAAGLAPAVIS